MRHKLKINFGHDMPHLSDVVFAPGVHWLCAGIARPVPGLAQMAVFASSGCIQTGALLAGAIAE